MSKVKDKLELFNQLNNEQGGVCVVPGCNYIPSYWWSERNRRSLLLHRVLPGRKGGKYTPENTVLVCVDHHIKIEGKSKQEIEALNPDEWRLNHYVAKSADGKMLFPGDPDYPEPWK